MTNIKHDQIREVYFQVFPTAEMLLNTQGHHSLKQSFGPVFNHKPDFTTYPNARLHIDLLSEEIAQTHNPELAAKAKTQLENNFVLNEMVHLSLMRSFDRQAEPFINQQGDTIHGYNLTPLFFRLKHCGAH